MKFRLKSFIFSFTTAFLLVLCFSSTASAQVTYTGGVVGDCCSSVGLAINAYGDIVGAASSAYRWQTQHPFLYTRSSGIVDLGSLGGDSGNGTARGINALGEVTGGSSTTGNATHAFLYSPSSGMADLGTLGGNFSEGIGINANGDVVGFSSLSDNTTTHPFLYSGGSMKDLGSLGEGSFGAAFAINDLGEIVGMSNGHPFLYTSGKMNELSVPGPPLAINNFGQIAGYYVYTDGVTPRLFLYSGGTVTDLGWGDPNYDQTLNNFSQIVGSGSDGPAFLYSPGIGMVQISSLLSPICESGQCFPWDHFIQLFYINSINDAGQVTGQGWKTDIGGPYTVLFSPMTSSLSPFQAKLQFIGKSQTHFRLRGSFTLGSDSTGFDPLTQQVLLQLGSLPVPIQKGLFSRDSKGDFVFQGPVASAAIDFRIKPVTSTTFKFEVEGLTGAPFRLTNPARFILMIGNNKTMGTLPWK